MPGIRAFSSPNWPITNPSTIDPMGTELMSARVKTDISRDRYWGSAISWMITRDMVVVTPMLKPQ